MKLLILDDDAQIREGIRKGIDWKSMGFTEVRSAADGFSGLEAAREMRPDIVLSDVRMPGMDGLEFLHKVKGLYPEIKVALISGYDDFEYLQKAIRYGADGYELKPVKLRNLFKLIEDLKARVKPGQKGGKKEGPLRGEDFDEDAGTISSLLAEQLKALCPAAGNPCSKRIQKAIDYVRSHLAEDLNVPGVAGTLRISANYFSSLFKRETGISFNSFVNQSRLRAAVYLLEHTGQGVSEIAAHTGFRDSVYFSQVFKKAMGCSPSGYRKKLSSGLSDELSSEKDKGKDKKEESV
jgi:YesN/AraC family two-component response regulator